MELWIRNQDNDCLNKVDNISVIDNRVVMIANQGRMTLGKYKTKERALEVLDEIQDKIKTLLYLKPNALLRLDDIKAAKAYFEELNKQEFITCDNSFEIVPISTHVVVYEMPKG